jgi:hypothetical protein
MKGSSKRRRNSRGAGGSSTLAFLSRLWQLRSADFALDVPASRARHLSNWATKSRAPPAKTWPPEADKYKHSFADVRACLRHYNVSRNSFCAPMLMSNKPALGDDYAGTSSVVCRGQARAFESDIGSVSTRAESLCVGELAYPGILSSAAASGTIVASRALLLPAA